MKDIVTPVPPEEVRCIIKKSLESAALVNYTRISEYAKIEGNFTALVSLFSALFMHWYISILFVFTGKLWDRFFKAIQIFKFNN